MRRLALLLGLLGIAVVMTACAGGVVTTPPADGGTPPPAGGGVTTPAAGGGVAATTISVAASDFKFDRTEIRARQNQEIEVRLKNDGAVAHDFTVTEIGAKTVLVEPGKTATVKFKVNKEGTFKFICSVPGHEAAGMHGEVHVIAV